MQQMRAESFKIVKVGEVQTFERKIAQLYKDGLLTVSKGVRVRAFT